MKNYEGTWDTAIEKYLNEYTQADHYDFSPEEKTRFLIEKILNSHIIQQTIKQMCRWFDLMDCIIQVGDRYLHYDWYHTTSDYTPWSMNLTFDISSVYFVEPKEKLTIVYEKLKGRANEV